MSVDNFVYESGSWSFRAAGYPSREAVMHILDTFIKNCPEGAKIQQFSISGMFGSEFEIRASWYMPTERNP